MSARALLRRLGSWHKGPDGNAGLRKRIDNLLHALRRHPMDRTGNTRRDDYIAVNIPDRSRNSPYPLLELLIADGISLLPGSLQLYLDPG